MMETMWTPLDLKGFIGRLNLLDQGIEIQNLEFKMKNDTVSSKESYLLAKN